MAVLVALVRGFARSKRDEVGNFWRDLVARDGLHPAAALGHRRGHPRHAGRRADARRDGQPRQGIQGFEQTIAAGPVAGQIAIKQLGTNGGGFFNVNSAHPFESGTARSRNFLEMFSILLIPAALTYTFGKWVGNVRQGWALFAVMMVLFVGRPRPDRPAGAQRVAGHGRRRACPAPRTTSRARSYASACDESALWAVATTGASNGSVNSMHDSYRPSAASPPMFNMGDRRGRLRRRRERALRHALLRGHRRVHRRPDGRAYARVPRQEDRCARGETLASRSWLPSSSSSRSPPSRSVIPAGTDPSA